MYQAVDVPCSLHERGFCVREKPCTHASVLDLSRSPFLCLCRSVLGHSILVPVPKSNIDTAISSNYRPVVLSSTLSKVLEWMILHKYFEFFSSSHLEFGFKPHSSTSICIGGVKNVVSCYIRSGSSVYGCFLDASKAFDLVDHSILFHKLLERGLPLLVVRFLLSWYTSQKCSVRWGSCLSDLFGVSNGVRQVVFSLLFFLLCIWMVYYLSWSRVVLVAIGKFCLLGVYAVLMILFYLHLVHLL